MSGTSIVIRLERPCFMSKIFKSEKLTKENTMQRNGTTVIEGGPPIRLSGTIKHETAKAILFSCDGQEMWLPKSVVEIDNLGEGAAVVAIPEWLASRHGLL
jgi:hypothetical protein